MAMTSRRAIISAFRPRAPRAEAPRALPGKASKIIYVFQEIGTLRGVERLTVSLEAEQVAMLRSLAAAHYTTMSAVVRAGAEALADEHTATGSIRRRIRPDARGGARPGAGRPRSDAGRAA